MMEFMGYAARLAVCPSPRRLVPNASPPMWTAWPQPSAIGIAMTPCAPTSPASACLGSARASSRWRRGPRHVQSRHQSMHHFVADAPWDAAAVLRVARQWVLERMTRHGSVAAWIVDDTAFPKKGQHSVGVARQYCGVLGKQDNG